MQAQGLGSAVRGVARSPLLDVVLALLLTAYVGLDALHTSDWPEPRWASAALAMTSAAFLAVRRVCPLISFTGALGALAAVYVALGHYETGSSVLVALVAAYSAGAYGGNLPFALALLAGFAATTGLGQPAQEAVPDLLWTFTALSLPLAVGLTAQRLRSRVQTAERRADLLKREQQALAEAVADEERRRIARELHDVISHGLGVVVLHAGAAEQVLDVDPGKAREALRLIRTTGQEAIAELGTLVGLIRDEPRPELHPQPTLSDVERLVATTRTAGLAVRLRTEGMERDLPASVELNAYRVVQEGLTNVLKHAGRAEVRVVLRYCHDGVEVEIADDGTGASPGPGAHRGLIGLRERVAVFGGRFEAGPDPRGGWKVNASFPTTS
ncbi:sensor histidine kinase [Streptomyces fulvoviolaceus]|uniref:sensor histidine kinase n=1 Tax=Streptomyces fulvoviolaceus TaxID=285535 RepID=UPI0009970D7C|nr:sensor histidine kinase [Streptomyces fulvoviolaceus]